MSIESLKDDLKTLIVECLMLEDVKPQDIGDTMPLFVDGLGLDSIDALELGLAISKKYKIKVSQDLEENKEHFANIDNLAQFVQNKVQAVPS